MQLAGKHIRNLRKFNTGVRPHAKMNISQSLKYGKKFLAKREIYFSIQSNYIANMN